MNGCPVRWRASWAFARITGVLFSSAVWLVLLATSVETALAALAGGGLAIILNGTPLVLRLARGARPAEHDERDAVLAAIVPVTSLRGRNQPQVWIARGCLSRGWDVLAPRQRTLLVSEQLLTEIRSGQVSDLQVSALVAHAAGQLPAQGSRMVLAVGIYCLPWVMVQTVAERVSSRLARVPLVSLSWRMRPVVFGLGLLDAVPNARWEAAIPLVVLTALTYTTGPLRRMWQRKLAELGDRRVADEGLGRVFATLVLNPRDPGDRRRATVLLEATR